MIRVLV